MTQNNLNDFLDKVMTIEISTVNGCLDLSRYNQTSDTAEDIELRQLQQHALTELLMFDKGAIQNQLSRMNHINQRFEKFWKFNFGKFGDFQNGTLDELSFVEKIKALFIVPKFQNGHITLDFLHCLHDAIMFKHGYLLGLIEQVNKILKPDPPEKVPPVPPKTFIDYLNTSNNSEALEYLKDYFAGKKGSEIAYMIIALKRIHALTVFDLKPLYESIKADFGDIGTYESIRKYCKDPDKLTPSQSKKYNGIYRDIVPRIPK